MFSLWWEHSDPGVIYNLVKPRPHCWPDFFFFLEVAICFFNWCLPAVTTLLDSCQHISIFQATYYLCTHFLWAVVYCGFFSFSCWKHFCVWCLDRKKDHSKNDSREFLFILMTNSERTTKQKNTEVDLLMTEITRFLLNLTHYYLLHIMLQSFCH